ncbi:hypothetical protein J6590_018545 [Homalodisca vitripennis]|nr:hypothetical protein J6590_018545 [Homalodisca vitripennis]
MYVCSPYRTFAVAQTVLPCVITDRILRGCHKPVVIKQHLTPRRDEMTKGRCSILCLWPASGRLCWLQRLFGKHSLISAVDRRQVSTHLITFPVYVHTSLLFLGGPLTPAVAVPLQGKVLVRRIRTYSPSARWGLRPQAPKVNACKFGDKRNSVTAPTVRPLSGLQKMPAGVKNARFFGNFFEGLKMKNSHFSGFSWWLHVESYLCTKFQVSNSSGSRLELVYVSEFPQQGDTSSVRSVQTQQADVSRDSVPGTKTQGDQSLRCVPQFLLTGINCYRFPQQGDTSSVRSVQTQQADVSRDAVPGTKTQGDQSLRCVPQFLLTGINCYRFPQQGDTSSVRSVQTQQADVSRDAVPGTKTQGDQSLRCVPQFLLTGINCYRFPQQGDTSSVRSVQTQQADVSRDAVPGTKTQGDQSLRCVPQFLLTGINCYRFPQQGDTSSVRSVQTQQADVSRDAVPGTKTQGDQSLRCVPQFLLTGINCYRFPQQGDTSSVRSVQTQQADVSRDAVPGTKTQGDQSLRCVPQFLLTGINCYRFPQQGDTSSVRSVQTQQADVSRDAVPGTKTQGDQSLRCVPQFLLTGINCYRFPQQGDTSSVRSVQTQQADVSRDAVPGTKTQGDQSLRCVPQFLLTGINCYRFPQQGDTSSVRSVQTQQADVSRDAVPGTKTQGDQSLRCVPQFLLTGINCYRFPQQGDTSSVRSVQTQQADVSRDAVPGTKTQGDQSLRCVPQFLLTGINCYRFPQQGDTSSVRSVQTQQADVSRDAVPGTKTQGDQSLRCVPQFLLTGINCYRFPQQGDTSSVRSVQTQQADVSRDAVPGTKTQGDQSLRCVPQHLEVVRARLHSALSVRGRHRLLRGHCPALRPKDDEEG